jgi:hypothetical protein
MPGRWRAHGCDLATIGDGPNAHYPLPRRLDLPLSRVRHEGAVQAFDKADAYHERGAEGIASSAAECLLCDAAIRRVRVRGLVEGGQGDATGVEERLGVERGIEVGGTGERSGQPHCLSRVETCLPDDSQDATHRPGIRYSQS